MQQSKSKIVQIDPNEYTETQLRSMVINCLVTTKSGKLYEGYYMGTMSREEVFPAVSMSGGHSVYYICLQDAHSVRLSDGMAGSLHYIEKSTISTVRYMLHT